MFLEVTTMVAAVPLAAATTAETTAAMSAVFMIQTPFHGASKHLRADGRPRCARSRIALMAPPISVSAVVCGFARDAVPAIWAGFVVGTRPVSAPPLGAPPGGRAPPWDSILLAFLGRPRLPCLDCRLRSIAPTMLRACVLSWPTTVNVAEIPRRARLDRLAAAHAGDATGFDPEPPAFPHGLMNLPVAAARGPSSGGLLIAHLGAAHQVVASLATGTSSPASATTAESAAERSPGSAGVASPFGGQIQPSGRDPDLGERKAGAGIERVVALNDNTSP